MGWGVRHVSARDLFDDFLGDAVTGVRLAAERRRSELGFHIGAPEDTVDWPPEARRVPARIRLVPDDAAIEAVGTAQDGRRFMLAAPSDEHDFIALFLWRADGEFDELLIDDLGEAGDMSPDEELALYERRVTQLGEFTLPTNRMTTRTALPGSSTFPATRWRSAGRGTARTTEQTFTRTT
jgi:hypothetical protein